MLEKNPHANGSACTAGYLSWNAPRLAGAYVEVLRRSSSDRLRMTVARWHSLRRASTLSLQGASETLERCGACTLRLRSAVAIADC